MWPFKKTWRDVFARNHGNRPIQGHLSNLRAHGGLCQLRHCKKGIMNAVGGLRDPKKDLEGQGFIGCKKEGSWATKVTRGNYKEALEMKLDKIRPQVWAFFTKMVCNRIDLSFDTSFGN